MKKIINKISAICFIIFDAFVDFLFCVRLLHDLKNQPYNEYKIKDIKVLLQFCGKSWDNSDFEYYCLNNEEYLYWFYYSLKLKNNHIFQLFWLVYCSIFCHIFVPILHLFIWDFHPKIRKFIWEKIYNNSYYNKHNYNNKIQRAINKNCGYEYLREYKQYYKNNLKEYDKIKYKIFIEETWLNICCWWNKVVTKNNRQSKLFINIDTLFFDIERYF